MATEKTETKTKDKKETKFDRRELRQKKDKQAFPAKQSERPKSERPTREVDFMGWD